MAPQELYSGGFRWIPVTKTLTLRLVCFSLIIVSSQCTNSSIGAVNYTRYPVPLNAGQRRIVPGSLHTSVAVAVRNYTSYSVPPDNRQHNLTEINELLRHINREPVVSFEGRNGEIIDCIPMYLQLSLDNPLLGNHTIQEPAGRPRYEALPPLNRTAMATVRQRSSDGGCPEGTIPVRRTTAEAIMRAPCPALYGKKYYGPAGSLGRFHSRGRRRA